MLAEAEKYRAGLQRRDRSKRPKRQAGRPQKQPEDASAGEQVAGKAKQAKRGRSKGPLQPKRLRRSKRPSQPENLKQDEEEEEEPSAGSCDYGDSPVERGGRGRGQGGRRSGAEASRA